MVYVALQVLLCPLLHELSHLILHYNQLQDPIVDYFDEKNSDSYDQNKIENQANKRKHPTIPSTTILKNTR